MQKCHLRCFTLGVKCANNCFGGFELGTHRYQMLQLFNQALFDEKRIIPKIVSYIIRFESWLKYFDILKLRLVQFMFDGNR